MIAYLSNKKHTNNNCVISDKKLMLLMYYQWCPLMKVLETDEIQCQLHFQQLCATVTHRLWECQWSTYVAQPSVMMTDYLYDIMYVINWISVHVSVYDYRLQLQARSKCYSMCYTELIIEDLPHIATIWTLWQRALSMISFITVAIVHTALITCILPNLSHRVPWGWEHVAMTLNYLLLNLN